MRKLHRETPGKRIARPGNAPVRAKLLFRPNSLIEKQKKAEFEKARFKELATRKTSEYVRISGELVGIMESILGVEAGLPDGGRRPALRVVNQGKPSSRAIQKKELLTGIFKVMETACVEGEVPRAARIYSLINEKCPGVVKEPEDALGLETLRDALRIMQEAKEFLEGVESGVLFDIEAEEYEEIVLSIYQMKYALSAGAPGKWENIMIRVSESDLGKALWEKIASPERDAGQGEIWISTMELFLLFEDSMLCTAEYFIEDGEEKINLGIPDWREFYGREREFQAAKSFAFKMNALLEMVCEVDRTLPGEEKTGSLVHVDFRKKE